MKNLTKAILASIVAIIASGAIVSQQAQATPILAGGTVTPVPPGVLPPVGNLVASSANGFNNGSISGTLNTFVYSGSSLGGYTFVYQIHMTGIGAEEITQLNTQDFAGLLVDVSQVAFGGTDQAVTDVSRSGSGDVLHWEFQSLTHVPPGLGTLNPGEDSYYLVAMTNATSFGLVELGITDGQTTNVFGYAPNVPDGGSAVAFLGVALTGIEVLRRKLRTA